MNPALNGLETTGTRAALGNGILDDKRFLTAVTIADMVTAVTIADRQALRPRQYKRRKCSLTRHDGSSTRRLIPHIFRGIQCSLKEVNTGWIARHNPIEESSADVALPVAMPCPSQH